VTAPQPSPDNDTDHGTGHDAGREAGHEADGPAAAGGRHDPWADPAPAPSADPPRTRPSLGQGITEALLVALPVAVLTGVPLGVLWLWLAPRVPLVSDGQAVLLANSEGEEAVGGDGTFLLAGLALGALAGFVVFLARRGGGVAVVIGLAVGAVGGSLLGWGIGDWFGPTEDIVAQAREAGAGVVFDGPLELSARGVLMGLPIAALAVHLLCVAAWGPRDEVGEARP
jgi:hypothetical protein